MAILCIHLEQALYVFKPDKGRYELLKHHCCDGTAQGWFEPIRIAETADHPNPGRYKLRYRVLEVPAVMPIEYVFNISGKKGIALWLTPG